VDHKYSLKIWKILEEIIVIIIIIIIILRVYRVGKFGDLDWNDQYEEGVERDKGIM
jgi:hypothetical protein